MDVWTIIDGKKIDLSSFIDKHPGGRHFISMIHGRDATALFHSYHLNFRSAQKTLSKLPVIEEVEGEYPKFDLLHQLQEKVLARFRELRIKYRTPPVYKIAFHISLFLFSVFAFAFLGWFWMSILTGIMLALIGINVMHSASHGSLTPSGKLNHLFAHLMDLVGGSSWEWYYTHVCSHHVYTGDLDKDEDIKDVDPPIRMFRSLSPRKYQKWQHIYTPVLFSLFSLNIHLRTFFKPFRLYREFPTTTPSNKLVISILIRLFSLFILIVLPALNFGFGYAIGGWLVAILVSGYLFTFIFVINHNTYLIQFKERKENGCWATGQIEGSANFGTTSKLTTWFTGGLNYQIEHHLFPSVNDRFYPLIDDIVKKESASLGIDYTEYPSIFAAEKDFYKLIYALRK